MIGASRETVSRAMKDFQEEGLIRVERRRIAVANRDALGETGAGPNVIAGR
jgi:CRP-like cAMP-binding protein